VHLHLDHSVALAGLAASAFDVEAEASGFIPACAGFRNGGKNFADGCE
jgi:hypothetical protein